VAIKAPNTEQGLTRKKKSHDTVLGTRLCRAMFYCYRFLFYDWSLSAPALTDVFFEGYAKDTNKGKIRIANGTRMEEIIF
ncbi:MAG: hypothetical protein ACI8RD_000486, partial [Bacillariaceae sp.]|jgi:hypothetical protein